MEDNDPEKLYRVQVGSFRDKSNAERMLNSLLMEGFPAFMIYEDGLYKVQVGAFRYLSNQNGTPSPLLPLQYIHCI